MHEPIVCPICGSDRVGTSEDIVGTAMLAGVNPDGTLEYTGETVIHWDTETTREDEAGRPLLACCACAFEWGLGEAVQAVA